MVGASLLAQSVKNPCAMQETWVWSLGWEDPLKKGTATHSSIFAWRIPQTEEPDRLQSVGVVKSQTQLSDFHFHFHCDRLQKWTQVIPTFLCDLVMWLCSFFYQFPLLITSRLTCNLFGSVSCGQSDICEFLSLDLRRPCRFPFSFLKPWACQVDRSELACQRMMKEKDALAILPMLVKPL